MIEKYVVRKERFLIIRYVEMIVIVGFEIINNFILLDLMVMFRFEIYFGREVKMGCCNYFV